MKIKDGVIHASQELMFAFLSFINRTCTVPARTLEAGDYAFLFRSGAKLIYMGKNRWRITTYSAHDGEAALLELRAANYMYLAKQKLKQLDTTMCTPKQYRVEWHGMTGSYSNGSLSSTFN